MKQCLYHVKPILPHVKACHRFVGHTVRFEKALELWASEYASKALEPYVAKDLRDRETVWGAWKRRMVCELDAEVTTWAAWDKTNGVFTGRDGKEKTVTGTLGFMVVLRGLYAPFFFLACTHMQKKTVFCSGPYMRAPDFLSPSLPRAGGDAAKLHSKARLELKLDTTAKSLTPAADKAFVRVVRQSKTGAKEAVVVAVRHMKSILHHVK